MNNKLSKTKLESNESVLKLVFFINFGNTHDAFCLHIKDKDSENFFFFEHVTTVYNFEILHKKYVKLKLGI